MDLTSDGVRISATQSTSLAFLNWSTNDDKTLFFCNFPHVALSREAKFIAKNMFLPSTHRGKTMQWCIIIHQLPPTVANLSLKLKTSPSRASAGMGKCALFSYFSLSPEDLERKSRAANWESRQCTELGLATLNLGPTQRRIDGRNAGRGERPRKAYIPQGIGNEDKSQGIWCLTSFPSFR